MQEPSTAPARPDARPESGTTHRKMRPDAWLAFDGDACLPLRFRQVTCTACVDACPVGCLSQDDEAQPSLGGNCAGCGRCVAACPTRALAVPGFCPPRDIAGGAGALIVDCWKVPRDQSPHDGVRVPCLGGLTVSRILELCADAPERPLLLADRGWCERCGAGSGATHPAMSTLQEARHLMSLAGTSGDRLPSVASMKLARILMPDAIPDPLAERRVSRRGFFRSVVGEVSTAIGDAVFADAEAEEAPRAAGARVIPVERLERLSILDRMTRQNQRELPAALFPTLAADEETCCNHRACAAACPTGALSAYEDEGASGVRFDSRLCLACGACERICPEQAMHVYPESPPEVRPCAARALTRFAKRECVECGLAFAEPGAGDTCFDCRRRVGLAQAGFALMMSARESARPKADGAVRAD